MEKVKENLEYYTITKKNENKKIELRFNNFKYNQSDIAYVMLNVSKTILPNYVYDISIDPGHGGSDPGATYGTYKEAEIALKYSIELKKELENLGLKVLITRDGTEDTSENSKFNVYSVYDENGRVNLIGNAKVKYNLSIHLNSLDTNTLSGTEIYAPANASLEIAKSFADNIVSIAGTSYSTRNINKAEEGVYVRTYTDEEIKESIESARKNGYEEYNITSSTPYLYMIREVGGIATGAYVDGRNTIYGTNKYYNSKIGVESYLIELGYIINQKDLNNMLNNQSAYIQAIVKTIEEKT
jgi:N-acetylmuramoyl-L-alanine amidase